MNNANRQVKTVDIKWTALPLKVEFQGRGSRRVRKIRSMVPKILRDIGPEHSIDFHIAEDNEASTEAAKVVVGTLTRADEIRRANTKRIVETTGKNIVISYITSRHVQYVIQKTIMLI